MPEQKKILIVAYHYPPEISGGTARPLLLEKYLVNRGHQVFLAVPQQLEKGVHGGQIVGARPVYKRKAGSGSGSILFKAAVRAANLFLLPDRLAPWGRLVAKKTASIKPDIIITTSPPESAHLAGLALKKEFPESVWIADLRDGWMCEPLRPETRWPVRGWLESRIEAKVFESADFVSFVSTKTLEDARARYDAISGKFHHWITGFDSLYQGAASRDLSRFVITHAGRFALSHSTRSPLPFVRGLKTAIAAAPEITSAIKVRILGNITAQEKEMFVAEPVLSKLVEFSGPLPHDAMLQTLASSDALLLVTAPDHLTAVPRKTFDYLSVKRPVLAITGESEAGRIVMDARAGVTAPPHDPGKISDAILAFWKRWKEGTLDSMFDFSGSEKYLAETAATRFFQDIGLDL